RFIEWGVSERDLYWVNAETPDGRCQDPRFIDELKPTRVIGMGRLAQRWMLKSSNVSYGSVHLFQLYLQRAVHDIPHPQYWRHYHSNEEYAPMKEALAS